MDEGNSCPIPLGGEWGGAALVGIQQGTRDCNRDHHGHGCCWRRVCTGAVLLEEEQLVFFHGPEARGDVLNTHDSTRDPMK